MRLCVNCAKPIDGSGWTCAGCGFAPSIAGGLPILAPSLAAGNAADATYAYGELCAAEKHHFWFVSRTQLIAWAIRRHFPDARSFFDAGCGAGGVVERLSASLPNMTFTAGDALAAGIAFARQRAPAVSFVQLDVRRLPYDREFDIVGAFDVIEHLDDDQQALSEIYRATKAGGGLIVTVPQHRFLWSAFDEYSCHRRRYSRRELVGKVERAGYVVERVTSFMTFTLPALVASRLRQRNPSHIDLTAELRLAGWMNSILRLACSVERAAIAAGVSFPAGGSLLIVARRPPS
jgi:SAM-dependent methyltransferase